MTNILLIVRTLVEQKQIKKMEKPASEIKIGNKIDWYGHGEYMEFGTVLNIRNGKLKNQIVFTIQDNNTSENPFTVIKLANQLIHISN